MATETRRRLSLLSSAARIQAPWIRVTIGDYTFGVFNQAIKRENKNNANFYIAYNVKYPNYIQGLEIVKINGQVNQYTLRISYPVRPQDDPNFFEKVFSSVSSTRKIVFSYGDSAMPTYVYKDEEAIITKITSTFNFGSNGQNGSVITYTVSAISSATLGKTGSFTFIYPDPIKPSDAIKDIFKNSDYGLQKIFTGMNADILDTLIAGDDKKVEVTSKTNISPLDEITYLASCMIPESSTTDQLKSEMYILTVHDDTTYDKLYGGYADSVSLNGPYFKIEKTSNAKQYSDAYEIDIGYNTAAIVTNFTVDQNENYSIYYDYTNELYPEEYKQTLDNWGQWESTYAPAFTSKNTYRKTKAEDSVWFTKATKYPINATITILGLLRPATLMTYVRINILFTGGNKHIYSGLYIVTKQQDRIDQNGYASTLSLTRIGS